MPQEGDLCILHEPESYILSETCMEEKNESVRELLSTPCWSGRDSLASDTFYSIKANNIHLSLLWSK